MGVISHELNLYEVSILFFKIFFKILKYFNIFFKKSPVYSIDFNPFKPNLIALGGNDVLIIDLDKSPAEVFSPG